MRSRGNRLAWVLATWFGCGLVPLAPGTAGTIGAIPLYLVVAGGGRAAVGSAALVLTAAGIWAASIVARDLGTKDPQVVVVDEAAGFFWTMVGAPHLSYRAIATGFVLFRVLDTTKPWPIRRAEALPGGWGIVLDDVAAGMLGACAMAVLAAVGAIG